jgi:HEAT repeat protein
MTATCRSSFQSVAALGLIASVMVAVGPAGCAPRGILTPSSDTTSGVKKGFPAPRDLPMDPALTAAARQELLAQLRSDLPSDRAHAIEGLRLTAPADAVGPVLASLDDRNQIVRFAAAVAAGELKLAEAKPKLLARLTDPDARVRAAVRFALHKLGDPSRTLELERFAKDFGPQGTQVRGATALLLGRLGEPSGANVLRLLRLDKESAVRQQAEEALALLGDERGINTILGFTVSADRYEQTFAMRALAELKNTKYRAYARTKLNSEYPEVALAATMAMGAMDADDGYGVATAGLTEKEPMARSLAAAAFGTIGRTDAQPLLAPLLKDPSADVRAAAATALLRIAKEPKMYNRQGERLPSGTASVE